jgi:hypothetical protein
MKHYGEYGDDFNLKRYDVLDCPFCGSKKTDLYQTQVQCERCDAHGPNVDDNNWPMAITLWNELPREKGAALEKLRRRWENLARKIRLAEKKAEEVAKEEREEEEAPRRRQERADRKWAREREAWLRSPIASNAPFYECDESEAS